MTRFVTREDVLTLAEWLDVEGIATRTPAHDRDNFNYAAKAMYAYADLLAVALTPPAAEAPGDDWRDDPSSDERWSAGVDYHAQQLCAVLGVDPKTVSWDAATEELEGDVRSVIGNILTAAMGESWMDRPTAEAPGQEDNPECTCCGGTGITYQTERRCACQGPAEAPVQEPVQDTWFVDRTLPIMAMSGDAEDRRVLKLHFRRPVSDEDRKALTDALNVYQAAPKGEG